MHTIKSPPSRHPIKPITGSAGRLLSGQHLNPSTPPGTSADGRKFNRAPLHQRFYLCNPSFLQRLLHTATVADRDGGIPAQSMTCLRTPHDFAASWAATVLLRLLGSIPVQRHLRLILRPDLVRKVRAEGKREGTAAIPGTHRRLLFLRRLRRLFLLIPEFLLRRLLDPIFLGVVALDQNAGNVMHKGNRAQ